MKNEAYIEYEQKLKNKKIKRKKIKNFPYFFKMIFFSPFMHAQPTWLDNIFAKIIIYCILSSNIITNLFKLIILTLWL